MIHIIEDYYVDVDELNYTAVKKKNAIRNGESTTVYSPKGYFGSLKSAVAGIARMYRNDKLSEKDYTLEEAIKVLQTADNVLESVLYRAFGEK